jgi:eukaryotic-like serine/threonine-protein kinase
VSWRGPTRRFLPYVVAMAGGFMLAYLVVAFFVFPSGVVPRDEEVPSVVGLLYDDAERELSRKGFKPERGETRFHATAPTMTVLEQNPPAGSRELVGARVTLAVSGGQQMGTVPTVIGMTREQAEVVLETAGFTGGEIIEQASQQPRGEVIETRPAAGSQAPMSSAVTLVLSGGPSVLQVPDLVGRSLGEARRLLEQIGLVVGDVTTEGGGGSIVVGTSPEPGASVPSGSRVNLRVAGGTP